MRRIVAALVLCLAVAAACGGVDEESGPGATGGTETGAPAPTQATDTVSETVTDGTGAAGPETAPITVEAPVSGATVSSPIAFKGTATVFEATVSIALLGATGEKLGEQFVTATCGNGCRGTYSGTIDAGTYTGAATLRFYESSADDGTPLHVVEVPIEIS